jgi:hypothetical protein
VTGAVKYHTVFVQQEWEEETQGNVSSLKESLFHVCRCLSFVMFERLSIGWRRPTHDICPPLISLCVSTGTFYSEDEKKFDLSLQENLVCFDDQGCLMVQKFLLYCQWQLHSIFLGRKCVSWFTPEKVKMFLPLVQKSLWIGNPVTGHRMDRESPERTVMLPKGLMKGGPETKTCSSWWTDPASFLASHR